MATIHCLPYTSMSLGELASTLSAATERNSGLRLNVIKEGGVQVKQHRMKTTSESIFIKRIGKNSRLAICASSLQFRLCGGKDSELSLFLWAQHAKMMQEESKKGNGTILYGQPTVMFDVF